jgi:putative DNA primase/helicase
MTPRDLAGLLGGRIDRLAADLLPAGHREGHEWRCGSIAGEPGHSLGLHLTGAKAGIWCDFSTGQKGDALDLVAAVLGLDMREALAWSRRWLGLDEGVAALPARPVLRQTAIEPQLDPDRWRRPWSAARPIAGTLGETYLAGRGLRAADPAGRVLRFAPRRARKSPEGQLEHHPALLAALNDFRTGEACGIINVFLRPNGGDRLRDSKGKTATGRTTGAAVMLSRFDDVTLGLTVCEGLETGVALLMTGLAPVWALGGAGNLAHFPVLAGVDALTIAADADPPGQVAAATVAGRWRDAGREAVIIAPPAGDWAAPRAA